MAAMPYGNTTQSWVADAKRLAVQANGNGTPRSASKRAPAPMPAAAKEALTENGGGRSRARAANGKASPAKKEGAWSEEQELALVQVNHFSIDPGGSISNIDPP